MTAEFGPRDVKALAELQSQFVDGEIDERELAARVEEVMTRD